MARLTSDAEFNTLRECNYSFPSEVLGDVREATLAFPNLHLHVDYYCFPNKEKKKLVQLRGTVPIRYEGNTYNIPVLIWIHKTHPHNPPRCYVCPSSSMTINSKCTSVDKKGHILLHCLSNWKTGWSNLSIVLEEMVAAFQRETPLFASLPVRASASAVEWQGQHRPVSSQSSWPHTSSSSVHRKSSHPEMLLSSTQSTSNTLPKSAKGGQLQAGGGEASGVKRSYTQELLDFGITFGDADSRTHPSTNPFTPSTSSQNTNTSNPDDIDDLFKSLQLERVVNMYQLESYKDTPSAWRQSQAQGLSPVPRLAWFDNGHKVVISHLPVGVPPRRMKNKLTIYFQKRQSGGGEVVAVTYPADQPDQAIITFRYRGDAEHILKVPNRLISVDEWQVLIQLKRYEGPQVPVPEGVWGEKADMFRSILEQDGCNFSPADVLEAVQVCRDLPSALKYLSHDCPICQEQVSFSKMITMTHCSCAFCESCFKAYFSSVIKEKSVDHAVCPLCNKPDVRGAGRREESMEYFSLLDTQIRHYLDPQTHELFQSKLRDRALQEMPSFRWCAHCSFGLLHEADRLRMDCPSCGKSTCFKCKNPWAPQHEGLSCEKFREWQQLNNPEFQASRLEHLLSRNKIDCPKCRFRFYLAKGGCLHFKCTQCQHEFCGGCGRPFRTGSACDFSAECRAKGLHAHHPRDCLYHLRDWDVPRLLSLLQHYGVSQPLMFRRQDGALQADQRGLCGVFEHKETGSVKEEPCGRPAMPEYNGYCMLHYKECLVELINQKSLDPVVLFDGTELRTELDRWKVPAPEKQPLEADRLYEERLRQLLSERVGLTGGVAPQLKPAAPPTPSPSPSSPPAAGAPWYAMLNPGKAQPEDSQLLLMFND